MGMWVDLKVLMGKRQGKDVFCNFTEESMR